MLQRLRQRQRQQQTMLSEQQDSEDQQQSSEESTPLLPVANSTGGTLEEDEGNCSPTFNPSSDEDSDSNEEEDSDDSDFELDIDNYFFLQPVPTRQRRVLLRESGVRRIESVEKDECKDIRSSREMCGCSCKTYCDPETCSCAQADIKCQVSLHVGCNR